MTQKLVIDADGHVSESADIDWQPYLEDDLKPLAAVRRTEDGELLPPAALDLLGDDRIVYASDYCHYDSSFPESVRIIQNRDDISQQAKDKVLGENARKLFGPRLLDS